MSNFLFILIIENFNFYKSAWKEKDLFGPSIYFELKQSGIYSPVDYDFLWNNQTVSFCVLNERMIGELGFF